MPQKQKTNELDLLLQKILFERAIEHIAAGRNRRAATLLQAVVQDFPENHKARDRLVRVYTIMAKDRMREGDMARARTAIEKAIALDPDNRQVLALSGSPGHSPDRGMQPELTARIRHIAASFVQRYYPDQSKWLEPAWRIFAGFAPGALNEKRLTGTLASMGEEESGRVVAHTVIILSAVAQEPPGDLTAEQVAEIIRRTGKRLGADKKLINRLVRHGVDFLPSA